MLSHTILSTHPLYSLDKQDFVPVEVLRVGERLLNKSGIVTLSEKVYDATPQAVYNLEVGQWHNFLVGVSGVVAHNGPCSHLVEYLGESVPVYRGGKTFKARPRDIELNPISGNVQTNKGVSVSVESSGLESFGGAHEITELPEGLKIIQSGKPTHFEIVPQYEMPLETYQNLLNSIQVKKI